MKQKIGWLISLVVGFSLLVAALQAALHSLPAQAALQAETPMVSLTPYPPVVEMAEGDPAVIILGAALIVLIIIGGFIWARRRQ